jgi:hypothetical protein
MLARMTLLGGSAAAVARVVLGQSEARLDGGASAFLGRCTMSDANHYRNPAVSAGGALVLATCLIRLFFPGCGKTGQDLARYEIAQAGGRIQYEIAQAGGHTQVDENAADKPVVRVDFDGLRQTGSLKFAPLGDEGLAYVRPYLEGLPRLRYLRIPSMAMISDSGLSNLEGLTHLETIELYGYMITQAGVDRLRQKLPGVQIHFTPSFQPFLMPIPK